MFKECIKIGALLLSASFLFHGCTKPEAKAEDQYLEKIIAAFDSKDASQITALYGKKAAQNLDAEELQAFLDSYSESESYLTTNTDNEYDSNDHGEVYREENSARIVLYTEDNIYYVIWSFVYRDDSDSENEGISNICIYTAKTIAYENTLEEMDLEADGNFEFYDDYDGALDEMGLTYRVVDKDIVAWDESKPALDADEIVAFMNANPGCSKFDFAEQFGQPNGGSGLPEDGVYPWYLYDAGDGQTYELFFDSDENVISGVGLRDAEGYVKSIWSDSEE